MGDDIGMSNIATYHRGPMAGATPNIDRLAAEGAIFTDCYAGASCTADPYGSRELKAPRGIVNSYVIGRRKEPVE